jgi:hypothetical protein
VSWARGCGPSSAPEGVAARPEDRPVTPFDITVIRGALCLLPSWCPVHRGRLDRDGDPACPCCPGGRVARARRDALAVLDQQPTQP